MTKRKFRRINVKPLSLNRDLFKHSVRPESEQEFTRQTIALALDYVDKYKPSEYSHPFELIIPTFENWTGIHSFKEFDEIVHSLGNGIANEIRLALGWGQLIQENPENWNLLCNIPDINEHQRIVRSIENPNFYKYVGGSCKFLNPSPASKLTNPFKFSTNDKGTILPCAVPLIYRITADY